MRSDLQPHTLLRISGADDLETDSTPTDWVADRLRQAPWVVVRRTRFRDALIPVGVRGQGRSERFAAWLCRSAILQCCSPQQLAAQRGWQGRPRRGAIPALAALDGIETVMHRHDLGLHWGPVGSVGFELATGIATTNPGSDVDVVIQLDGSLPAELAATLLSELTPLPCRVDVLIEMPHGAVALADCAHRGSPYLLRTPDGAYLVDDLQFEAGAA
jgi:phosphoribosyl-dephospho-CoA transferase